MSWRRMDLHLHTPASTDYQQAGVSALDILRKAEERGLDIIAFTDHNSVRGYADLWREIEDLELLEYLQRLTPAEADRLAEFRRLLAKLLLLPGFEFTATFGFHILAIFPETTSIRLMEHLLLALGVAEDRFGSGEVGATSDVLRAYEILAEHGALVIGAHVNSAHGIAMQGMRFGGQTKIAYTQDAQSPCPGGDRPRLRPPAARPPRFSAASRPSTPAACIASRDPTPIASIAIRTATPTSASATDRRRSFCPPPRSPPSRPSSPARTLPASGRPGPAARRPMPSTRRATPATPPRSRSTSGSRRPVPGPRWCCGTSSSFANGNGGTVYVGVGAADRRLVPGVPDAAKVSDRDCSADIAGQIRPAVAVEIEVIDYGGKTVLALRVPEGSGQALRARARHHPGSPRRRVRRRLPATRSSPWSAARPTAPRRPWPKPPPRSTPTEPLAASRARDAGGRATAATKGETSPRRPMPQDGGNRSSVGRSVVAPRTGVEIVSDRGAGRRDLLRACAISATARSRPTSPATPPAVSGSTRSTSARRKQLDEGHIRWKGDFGFWKIYRPTRGERRYNLAYRSPGAFRIFYGVTEDGLDDRWRAVIPSTRRLRVTPRRIRRRRSAHPDRPRRLP